MKNERGFTLIELLVVIAIIGMLASIILASLNSARKKGEDAARAANVKSIERAVELYYDDNGTYPQSTGSGNGDVLLSDATLVSKLVPKYLGSMPPMLIADGDHYYGVGTSGGTSQYGLLIYTNAGGWCKTGVSNGSMASNGWWGALPVCKF